MPEREAAAPIGDVLVTDDDYIFLRQPKIENGIFPFCFPTSEHNLPNIMNSFLVLRVLLMDGKQNGILIALVWLIDDSGGGVTDSMSCHFSHNSPMFIGITMQDGTIMHIIVK